MSPLQFGQLLIYYGEDKKKEREREERKVIN